MRRFCADDATRRRAWRFSSQSGALGLAILEYARRLDLGISTFVSVGNKADVSGNDLLQYWADDPRTDVILLYLESFGNPRKFAGSRAASARRKPIVAVKAGRSERRRASGLLAHRRAGRRATAWSTRCSDQAGVIRTAHARGDVRRRRAAGSSAAAARVTASPS